MGGHYLRPRTIDDIRDDFETCRRLFDNIKDGPNAQEMRRDLSKALSTQGMTWYRDVGLLLTAFDELFAAFRSEGDTSSAKLFTGESGGS